ncbi:MAG: exo-alpha-sialidase [Chloroflexi bacterium]|nr:MAG: exo-alpha-sialidase [Chloroflexota bacterium]
MTLRTRLVPIAAAIGLLTSAAPAFADSTPTYDITTLAGKVASVNGTAGLQIRFSALIQQEADTSDLAALGDSTAPPITPSFVLSSPLDGTTVAGPAVTVNQDSAAASQNETAIAVDPNKPNRVVAAANDYVTRTWSCMVGSTPCSALGDGYSGTYVSNNGGQTWCCVATDPQHLGTLIPGVDHLAGGQYDAGGDPALTFDSRGTVYYAGLGFDRLTPPSTVAVNRGTFDAAGNLSWSAPTFINPTTSPSTLNDKEWIAADASASSRFRDRVYVTWTRFLFNGHTGDYVQSPIFEAHSSNGGATFSAPQLIGAPAIYDQGSRPVVAPDGTVYVFFYGSTRLAVLPSAFVVKSTDGGVSWSQPVAIAEVQPIISPRGAVFRVNSFPAAAVAPDGTLYATWSTQMSDSGGLCPIQTNAGCHLAAVLSRSTDGGATWSAPAPALPAVDASTRTAIGYPVTQPDGTTLNAPAARRADTFWPAVAVSPSGRVYLSAYAADVVSPWQTCAHPVPPPVGRINCLALGNYINNARLDYVVRDLTTGVTNAVTTHPINTRYHFGGGFIGDYTDIAVGSDNAFHALWTDTNNVQSVTWWYGFQFVPTSVHQQDVVTAAGNF